MVLEMLTSAEVVNERQKQLLVEQIDQHFGGQLADKHFAIWGLAFKPNTDDMRQASSRVLVTRLLEAGASVSVYDPVALEEARRCLANDVGPDAFERIRFCREPYQALHHANALIIATEWKEFRSPDFEQMKNTLSEMIVFDGRNLYDPAAMRESGWTYYTIGRNSIRGRS
jgi:UDPglucose 6-dehydrogenase